MLTNIWEEFVALLRVGSLTADGIRPYDESFRESMLGFAETFRTKADWTEWQADPEVHRVGNQVHFLLPLTFDGQQSTFCFSFLLDKARWYWQHVESIVIRLDQLASLPATEFPDLPEAKKAWMREEIRVSEQVRLFNWFAAESSKSFACDMIRDGRGYALTARAWIPFVAPSRAFVLYACWEQAKLRGNRVTLLKLDDREALIEIDSTFLKLYHQTGHLRRQILWEDYRLLFETIWQDRASHAGWELEITYDGDMCTLRFAS